MLNFFKKKVAQTITPIVEVVTMSEEEKTAKLIEQIHTEFLTAGDKLLKESEEILEKCRLANLDGKSERLKSLGFTSVPQVKESIDLENDKVKKEALANLVNKYMFKYPNYKFITEEIALEICKKYNLILGPISRYKGFVPEKNLSEIEKFKGKYPKMDKIARFRTYDSDYNCVSSIECYKLDHRPNSDYNSYYLGKTHAFQQEKVRDNGISYYGEFFCPDNRWRSGRVEVIPLQICAPLKDMDTTGMKLNGRMLEMHIPDPVVLQPVEGGYLILTAWGDEASDPLVVNQKMN